LSRARETRDSLSSSCSQIVLVYLQPFLSQFTLVVSTADENRKKNTKTPYFAVSRSFKVIDVNTAKQLATSACYDKQHVNAYCNCFPYRRANIGEMTSF